MILLFDSTKYRKEILEKSGIVYNAIILSIVERGTLL